jgi:rod shape-determining protein MreC
MRNLVEFINKYCHWILFVALEVVSVVLLFRYNSYQGSAWYSSANVVAGSVMQASSEVYSFVNLSQVNAELTRHNLQLEAQVRRLSEQLKAAKKDSTAVLLTDTLQGYELIPAKVVDNSVNRYDNYITIDKGSADGVRKDMGVASGTGVVGIVYLVSNHYSVVIPVLHSKSNISCSLQGSEYFGYLHWRGLPADIAYVDDVPRHAKLKLHEKVVTSGYSSVFPAGLPVGEVINIFNSPDGLSYMLQVRLATDFSRLRDVCVINDAAALERMKTLEAAVDSLKPRE